MASQSFVVRPLSVYTETTTSNSEVIDIGNSTEVHALLKVASTSGTTPSLAVKAQHSIDNGHFAELTGVVFTAATGPTNETKSASTPAYRYVRFQYTLSGTTPSATFEVHLFVKMQS